jgi:hypothetical protein
MSIGNLKDYGNKGNNFPFQKKVLDGLSLGRLGELKELVTSESNIVDLQSNIDTLFATYPNSYLVSKSIIFDGTDYIAFITVKLA